MMYEPAWNVFIVGAGGAEHGLPDVPLFAGAAVGAEDEFPAIGALGGGKDLAGRRAHLRLQDAAEGSARPIGVFVLVDVDHLIGVKIHRVRTGAPGAVEFSGIENLRR